LVASPSNPFHGSGLVVDGLETILGDDVVDFLEVQDTYSIGARTKTRSTRLFFYLRCFHHHMTVV
jgi:hypothetical protein